MTEDDIKAVADLACEESGTDTSFLNNAARTRDSLEKRVGRGEKRRRIEVAAATFLKLMEALGGTYVWEGPKAGMKFSDVWQGLAAQAPGFQDLGLMDKADFISQHAPTLRAGFYSARKWLAEWYMDTVFAVPQHDEASVLTVITLDPEYVLAGGRTAAEMQGRRDYKLADGQIVASTRRLAAATKQKDAVKLKLNDIMAHAFRELENMRPERAQR